MIKKVLCTALLWLMLLPLSVSALDIATPEFYLFGDNPKAVSEILGLTEAELTSYCTENCITYLAVNKDNTKQIRLSIKETSFSKTVGDLSNISDQTALTLASESLLPDSVLGEIATLNGQKFIKTEAKTSDSGGEFILTEYITVAEKKLYTYSFYTDINTDSSYIETEFSNFTEQYFKSEIKPLSPVYKYLILAAIILLALAIAAITFTIIKDIKKKA